MDVSLDKIWKSVRRRHYFPELPAPRYSKGQARVGLDIEDKHILISRDFVRQMSLRLDAKEVIEGLLDHAVSHYLYCPWDLATHFKLYAEAKSVLKDKEMARKATDYFMDVVADTSCVSQKETSLPNLYRHLDRGLVDGAIHALLQQIWGINLGVDAHQDISRKLSRLPYLDRASWPRSIRRFCGALQSLLEMEKNDPASSNLPRPMGQHKLGQYSPEEIRVIILRITRGELKNRKG